MGGWIAQHNLLQTAETARRYPLALLKDLSDIRTALSSLARRSQQTVLQIETLRVPSYTRVTYKPGFCYEGASSSRGGHGHENGWSCISSNEATEATMEFRVIWEIEIEADSPKGAAQEARTIQLIPGMSATVFDVWAHASEKMHRIDLVEEPERLDRDELFAVRAGLRLLQCNPDTPPNVQELATVILIFLDKDNLLFKRAYRGPSR